MNIAIIYSLPTRRALATPFKVADEDTQESAFEIAEALESKPRTHERSSVVRGKGADVVLLPVSEDTIDTIPSIDADVIFNLIEWDGLDMPLFLKAVGLIERSQIPFTGSGFTTMRTLSNKEKMKDALDLGSIPTPRWQLFRDGTEPVRDDFHYPVIMKLALTHCSIGLTRNAVIDRREDVTLHVKEHIASFQQPVYVEEFIDGREFQVTVIEEDGVPKVLPPAEIVFKKGGKDSFLTYESRWDEDHPDYKLSSVKSAETSAYLRKRLEDVSLMAFRSLGFFDYARMDIRARGEEPFVLEANTNPGLGDSDEYGMTVSYKAVGMRFSDFVWKIVESCLRRAR